MSAIREEIDGVLSKFRDPSTTMMYHQVYNSLQLLGNLLSEKGEEDQEGILSAEKIAFALHMPDDETRSTWGTDFGPWIEGKDSEYPKKSSITQPMLEYWKERGQQESCSILAARYNDIVWDLSSIVRVKSGIDCPQRAVDSYIDCIDSGRFELGMEERKYLRRARTIALQINDDDRQLQVEQLLVNRENKYADDNKPGTWGDGFELLFKGSKARLNDAEKNELLFNMESRLQRLSQSSEDSPEDINPNSVYYIASLLIKYYSQVGDEGKLKYAIETLNDIYLKYCNTQDALVSHHWLSMYIQLLSDYGYGNSELGIQIKHAVQKLGPTIKGNLKESTREESISRKKVENIMELINTDTLSSSLENYGVYFFHDLEEVEGCLQKGLAENRVPISDILCGVHNIDHNGRIKSIVGPMDSDIQGNAVIAMTRMMTGEVALLADFTMRNIIEKHNVNETSFTEALYKDSLLPEDKKEMIMQGIKWYLKEDYLSAIHILTPQVEACIRHSIQSSNGIVYQFRKDGSEPCKTLCKLLSEAERAGIYNRKLVNYFKVVLVDSRGFNIRNSVSHGLNEKGFFCKTIADRLLHTLILISLLK